MHKVYIVGYASGSYASLFYERGFEITRDPEQADLLCFTGGEDVTPAMYGQIKHKQTYNNFNRDQAELALFEQAVGRKIPCVGICRGGQFLNVVNGGQMYQHVTKHTSSHDMIVKETGEIIKVSSTHHQMMMPSEEGQVLAIAKEGSRREWYSKENELCVDVSEEDIEVVLYEKTLSLCFQPHPEWNGPVWKGMQDYFFKLVFNHLLK